MEDTFIQFSDAVFEICRTIRKIERQEIEKYGLKHGHAHVLKTILRAGEAMTATKLCTVCEKDKAAISRILAELTQAGLVYRKTDRGNHYRAEVCLTEKGYDVARQVEERSQIAIDRASEGLSKEQLKSVYQSLSIVADNLRCACSSGW